MGRSSKSQGKKKKTKAEKEAASKRGRRSRIHGGDFERKVAQDMRQIYDSSDLLNRMELAKKEKRLKDLRMLQKASKVRRSDQGKGAKEPDLVIEGCPCWFEVQSAGRDNYNPAAKLEQAERDTRETDSELWPVAICRLRGSPQIIVCTRVWVLMALLGLMLPEKAIDRAADIMIKFDYSVLLDLMKWVRDGSK